MAEAGVETESAADRLEAALERIAALSSRRPAAAATEPAGPMGDVPPDLTRRLDALIAALRQSLDGPAA
jgi:hypothetical protein